MVDFLSFGDIQLHARPFKNYLPVADACTAFMCTLTCSCIAVQERRMTQQQYSSSYQAPLVTTVAIRTVE